MNIDHLTTNELMKFFYTGDIMKYQLLLISLLVLSALAPVTIICFSSEGLSSLTRSDDNDTGNATEIAINSSAADTLDNETDFVDWYKVEVTAGDILVVNLTVPDTGDLSLTVYDANLRYLMSGSNAQYGGYEEVMFLANMTDYYIELFARWGNGSYTLRVDKYSEFVPDGNDYIYLATKIEPTVTLQDDLIQGLDDHDYFKFHMGVNDELHATLVHHPTQNFDLFLLAENGTVIEGSTNFSGMEEFYYTCKEDGSYHVRASAVWGSGDYVMTVMVARANRPPEIISYLPDADPVTVGENSTVEFSISASDPENDILKYVWKVGNLTVQGNNDDEFLLYTTYNETYSSGNYAVTVMISDQYNTITFEWSLVVMDVNPKPEIRVKWPLSAEVTINENENALFRVEITDPDGTLPMIQWSLNEEVRSGETGSSYSFKTNYSMSGIYTVKISITDALDTAIVDTRQWTVNVLNVDRRPQVLDIYPPVNGETNEESALDFLFNVTDPDGDVLTYAWHFDGVKLVGENSHGYTFTPDYNSSDGIQHEITVEVTSGNFSLNNTWTLYIEDVNRRPGIDNSSIIILDGKTYKEGKDIDFTVTVEDPDNDQITYSWINIETGEEFSTESSFAKSFKEGNYKVRLTVDDGKGGVDEFEFGFEVKGEEESPGFGVVILLCAAAFIVVAAYFRQNNA